MKEIPVGIQVYSVRDDAAKDFKGTVQKLKDMGYDGVELAGLYGHEPSEIRRMLDEVGIAAISAHVPYLELIGDMEKTVSDYKTIGCEYIAIPYLNEEYRPGTANFDEVLENIRKLGECCNRQGITLLYHNHDFEFVKMEDGSYGLDYIYNHVDASLLQTELDTCWVRVAGECPSQYIEKYAGRCPVVHLKDYVGQKSEHMYELIGIQEDANQDEKGEFAFRPVGHGVQNMAKIVETSIKSGAKWVIVEQDQSLERPAIEAAKMSIDYIRSL